MVAAASGFQRKAESMGPPCDPNLTPLNDESLHATAREASAGRLSSSTIIGSFPARPPSSFASMSHVRCPDPRPAKIGPPDGALPFPLSSRCPSRRRNEGTRRTGPRMRPRVSESRSRQGSPAGRPPAQVGEWLKRVVQGYYQYHAVPGNLHQLSAFRHRLCRLWRGVLNRRSQRGERPWQRLVALLERWIPFPRVLHPYPQQRFAVRHPR